MPTIPEEWTELIDSLMSHEVEFLVVGAHALALHGHPRLTLDLDVWVRRSMDNSRNIREALIAFGFDIGKEGEQRFATDEQLFQIGSPPHRIDMLTFLSGCDFDEAWPRRVFGTMAGVKNVPFLSLEDFIATKIASGRSRDLADLQRLQEIGIEMPDGFKGP